METPKYSSEMSGLLDLKIGDTEQFLEHKFHVSLDPDILKEGGLKPEDYLFEFIAREGDEELDLIRALRWIADAYEIKREDRLQEALEGE